MLCNTGVALYKAGVAFCKAGVAFCKAEATSKESKDITQ
jgi:hypothetical protein